MRVLPRQLNVRLAQDLQTGGEHNVPEICDPKYGVRYVMEQDSEIHKELDAYKLKAYKLKAYKVRANYLKKKNNKLEEALKRVSNYVERLEARVEFLERQPRDSFLPENTGVTSK